MKKGIYYSRASQAHQAIVAKNRDDPCTTDLDCSKDNPNLFCDKPESQYPPPVIG